MLVCFLLPFLLPSYSHAGSCRGMGGYRKPYYCPLTYLFMLVENLAIILTVWGSPSLHRPMYYFLGSMSFLEITRPRPPAPNCQGAPPVGSCSAIGECLTRPRPLAPNSQGAPPVGSSSAIGECLTRPRPPLK